MEMWMDHTVVDERGVQPKRARPPKANVIIKAHNKSTVTVLASVIDSSREAGIYNVSLSTGD